MKKLQDFDFTNKRVLVRSDLNVPLDEKGNILDDFRIEQSIPTLKYLIEKAAKLILMSHLDRPEGRIVEGLKLTPIKEKLEEYLDLPVAKTEDCIGFEIEDLTLKMKPGEILLLENLRFHKEEEEGDLIFAQKLSKLGDIYINDAFGACHRSHASIIGVPKYLPAGAGFLLKKEIENLQKLIEQPQKPMVAIIGGKKVETKVKLIDRISKNADFVVIGGLIQKELKEKNIKLQYPEKVIGPIDEIGGGLDIGHETIKLFKDKISSARTIFWNGPLGKIEEEKFSKGTEEIAKTITQNQVFSVVGGGETIEFIRNLNLTDKFTHISTGGGAMLTFLSGEKLPGIESLHSVS